jgi:hypothetical protein
MKPSEIVYQLRELQDTWRRNNFNLNEGQQVTYDKLLQLRRERVRFFYDNNLVFKGSKAAWDKEQAEEAAEASKVAAEVEASEEY